MFKFQVCSSSSHAVTGGQAARIKVQGSKFKVCSSSSQAVTGGQAAKIKVQGSKFKVFGTVITTLLNPIQSLYKRVEVSLSIKPTSEALII